MPRFRKRPVEIEAWQWTGGDYDWLNDWLGHNWGRADVTWEHEDHEEVVIWNVLEKVWIPVPVGHWIIRGVSGEVYPCEPGVFDATYEPISYELDPMPFGEASAPLLTDKPQAPDCLACGDSPTRCAARHELDECPCEGDLTDKPQTCEHGKTYGHPLWNGPFGAPVSQIVERCPGPVSINPGEQQ